MYKTDIIRKVASETRLSQRIVSDVVGELHRLIEQALREGKSVTFPGFGTFYSKQKQGGKVRDVRTGEMVEYEARQIAAFRVGEVLKRAVRGQRRRGGLRRRKHPGADDEE
jgi:nucleoid DNA-binding protein